MPAKIPLLDLRKQTQEIQEELGEVFERTCSNTDFIQGTAVSEFERAFAKYLSVSHVIGCGSGTDALALALKAAGLPPRGRVLVPSLTFVATAEAVILAGGSPEFLDANDETELLTAQILEERLRSSSDYWGVVPVHLRGNVCDMDGILEVCKKNDLKVIEDAAQAHGSTFKGQKAGSFGLASAFSFYPGKNLGALGDGGAVATNDSELAKNVRLLRDHGRIDKYNHRIPGQNSRLDTLQAAFLNIKLKHLDGWNDARRSIASLYSELLSSTSNLKLQKEPNGVASIYHHYAIRVPERDKLKQTLGTEGISSGIHYPIPLHKLESMRSFVSTSLSLPFAEHICDHTLSLPIFPELSKEEIARIAKVVINHCRRNCT